MRTSAAGRRLIKEFEGEKLTAYICPAGVLTIGVGHTGADVKPGKTITADESDKLLQSDLQTAEQAVTRMAKVAVTQNQFDALVSFVFNVGPGAFRSSTLLRLLNAGDYYGAADEFPKWNKGGGKVLPGLTKRRAAERAMFLRG